MTDKPKNFSVPLPTEVDVKVEENVIQKDFSGYLTRALAWTALTPLFMLGFMHFSQLMNATEINDWRQIEITRQLSNRISEEIYSLANFLKTSGNIIRAEDIPVRSTEALFGESAKYQKLFDISVLNSEESHEIESPSSADAAPIGKKKSFIRVDDRGNFCIREPVTEKSGKKLLLQGCISQKKFSEIIAETIRSEPFTVQLFTNNNRSIFQESLNTKKQYAPFVPTEAFMSVVRSHLLSPHPLWRTDQVRNNSQVLSASSVKATGWLLVVGQPVAVRDEQLSSSLLTSGAFLILGLIGTFVVGSFLGTRLTRSVECVIEQLEEFKKNNRVVTPSAERFKYAPLELQTVSKQFKSLAQAVVSSQEKLKLSNETLTEQVNLRTASLNKRNEELKSLQQLLAPLEEPPKIVIGKTIERFKEILSLEVLYFTDADKIPNAENYIAVKSSANEVLGYLCFATVPGQEQASVFSSILRLARSISIVLDNENMFRSIKVDHSRFTALMESMSEGVILIRQSGSFLFFNKKAENLLGITEQTPLNSVGAYLSEGFRTLFSANADEAHLIPHEPGVTRRLVSKTDSDFFLEISTFIVPHFQGYGQRMGLIIRDISKEMSIERMKGNLVSIVAHELKTPITTMRLQAETLDRMISNGRPEDAKELIGDMLSESTRLQNLISDWLDVSRIEAGALVIRPKVQSLGVLLRMAEKVVKQHYPDLKIETNIDKDAQCILVDKDRILQVFINILDNAARYRSSDSPICLVSSSLKGKEIEVSFSDNGVGVPPTHLSKIFDTFYQVDISNRRKVGGTGLGLAICRGIMAAHGGRIWAECHSGKGITIKLRFHL